MCMHRIARLPADIHAVLDRIEAPELLLHQAVRGMEGGTAGGLRCARKRNLSSGNVWKNGRPRKPATKKLALCFEANRENLAEKLIRRRLEMQRTREPWCGSRNHERGKQSDEVDVTAY